MNEQQGCLGKIARVTAATLLILTILTMPLASLMRSAEGELFSSDTLSNLFEARLISSGFIRNLVTTTIFQREALEDLSQEGVDFTEAFAYLGDEERQEIVDRLLPNDWLTAQVEILVAGTLDWLENDKVQPDLRLDLSPLRDNMLRGGAAASMAEITVDSWPECSDTELGAMLAYVGGELDQPPFCEPPDPLRYELIDQATLVFRTLAEGIPMEIRLGEELARNLNPARAEAFKNTISGIRRLADASMLLPWTFLGLIMALVVRSWIQLLRWWGATFGLSGVFGLMAAFRLSNEMEERVAAIVLDLRNSSPELSGLLGEVLDGLSSRILEGFALKSLLLALFGGGTFVVGWLLHRGLRFSPKRKRTATNRKPDDEEGSNGKGSLTPSPPAVDPLSAVQDEHEDDPPTGMYA